MPNLQLTIFAVRCTLPPDVKFFDENKTYLNSIGLLGGSGYSICLSDCIRMNRHATAVKTMAPTAIGQKSLGVASWAIGHMRSATIIVQSQNCMTNDDSRSRMLCEAIRRNMTETPISCT
jgi:hypothetical protein